jgi:hypothetical protein
MKLLRAVVTVVVVIELVLGQDVTPTPAASEHYYDERGCWECPANQLHWYQLGLDKSLNGDACQCIEVEFADGCGIADCPCGVHSVSQPLESNKRTHVGCPICKPCATNPDESTSSPNSNSPSTSNSPGSSAASSPNYPPSGNEYISPDYNGACWPCKAGWKHFWELGVELSPGDAACTCYEEIPKTKLPTTTQTDNVIVNKDKRIADSSASTILSTFIAVVALVLALQLA